MCGVFCQTTAGVRRPPREKKVQALRVSRPHAIGSFNPDYEPAESPNLAIADRKSDNPGFVASTANQTPVKCT